MAEFTRFKTLNLVYLGTLISLGYGFCVESSNAKDSQVSAALYDAIKIYQEVASKAESGKDGYLSEQRFIDWFITSANAEETDSKVCLFLGAAFTIPKSERCNLAAYEVFRKKLPGEMNDSYSNCLDSRGQKDSSKIACSMPEYGQFSARETPTIPSAVCVNKKDIMGSRLINGKTVMIPKYKNTVCQKEWEKVCTNNADGKNDCIEKMAAFLTQWENKKSQAMYRSFQNSYKNLAEQACVKDKFQSPSCQKLLNQMELLAKLLKDDNGSWRVSVKDILENIRKKKPVEPQTALFKDKVTNVEFKASSKLCCSVVPEKIKEVRGGSLPLNCDGNFITIDNITKARFFSAKVDLFDDRNNTFASTDDAELLNYEFNEKNSNNGDVIQVLMDIKNYESGQSNTLVSKKPINVEDREYLILKDSWKSSFKTFVKQNKNKKFKDVEGVRFSGPVCFDVGSIQAKDKDGNAVEVLGQCDYRTKNLILSDLGSCKKDLKTNFKPVCWAQATCSSSKSKDFDSNAQYFVVEAFCGTNNGKCPKSAKECALASGNYNGGKFEKLNNFKFIDSKKPDESAEAAD